MDYKRIVKAMKINKKEKKKRKITQEDEEQELENRLRTSSNAIGSQSSFC